MKNTLDDIFSVLAALMILALMLWSAVEAVQVIVSTPKPNDSINLYPEAHYRAAQALNREEP